MSSKYPEIDLSGLRTLSIGERKSKVSVADFATPHLAASGIGDFIDSLPDILAGKWIKAVIDRIVLAREHGKPVIFAMGAHVVKCGLGPIVIDLIRRGAITALAMNGAGAIHDSEIARYGETSEDVVEGMRTGMFGMARETAEFLNECAKVAQRDQLGFGESIGKALVAAGSVPPSQQVSILAAAYECNVPLTVHVSVGSDVVHMHPSADGAGIGDASLRDFRILARAMADLGGGGVLMNVGSAVVLPEVVLKAFTVLINLGNDMSGMTGVNLDFVQHYRSNQQVVARVREIGGEGIALTGHHEIMLPLIAAGIIERTGA